MYYWERTLRPYEPYEPKKHKKEEKNKMKELRIPKGARYEIRNESNEIVITYEEQPEITTQEIQDAALAGKVLKSIIKALSPFVKQLEKERKQVEGYRK